MTDHHMFPSKYNPEAEENGVEDALTDVTEEQHEGHVEPEGHPLHWH